MLCFTIKCGEYFTVGGDTVVLFDQLAGDRAHLSIEAPRDVPIVRGTVLEREGAPKPAGLTSAPPRKKPKYKPDAVFCWNDDRERAVKTIEKVADLLEKGGSGDAAKLLRLQVDRLVPKVWEDNLAAQ